MPKTQKTKLEEVREEIIKAVLEILDLKFGCEIVSKALTPNWYIILGEDVIKNKIQCARIDIQSPPYGIIDFDYKVVSKRNFKILGRPVTLEDCFIALEKRDVPFRIGEIIKVFDLWQLGKPLHQQPPKTISFLHDLFFNKKDE